MPREPVVGAPPFTSGKPEPDDCAGWMVSGAAACQIFTAVPSKV
jgi:hypothetical protein